MGFVTDFIGDITGANKQADAAKDASKTQAASYDKGIEEVRRQFDALQQLQSPFVQAGTSSLTGQLDLAGLNGAGAQGAAINGIKTSPEFTSMLQQGENSILQNASATGGLRGGNTQAALAQFSPQLLSELINQQYARLGGITSLGQNAAAGVGNAGMATGQSIADLLGQQGAALAGGQVAAGSARRNAFGDTLKIASIFAGGF